MPLFFLLVTAVAADTTEQQVTLAAYAGARDAHSLSQLWLASFAPEAEVRQTALQTAQRRCPHESRTVCSALLRFFTADTLVDIAWSARDTLLSMDAAAALTDAPQAYKLDLLSSLAGRMRLPAEQMGRILRILVVDADAAVQENAAWLLENTP